MSGVAAQNLVAELEAAGFSPDRYQSLATTMDKDEGTAIFRRFGDLNMLNLLSLQAELLKLRSDLKAMCVQKTMEIEDDAQGYLAAYSLPSRQQEQEADDVVKRKAKERLELQIHIREKLKEYSKLRLNHVM
jgi:ribosomal protein L29